MLRIDRSNCQISGNPKFKKKITRSTFEPSWKGNHVDEYIDIKNELGGNQRSSESRPNRFEEAREAAKRIGAKSVAKKNPGTTR